MAAPNPKRVVNPPLFAYRFMVHLKSTSPLDSELIERKLRKAFHGTHVLLSSVEVGKVIGVSK